MKSRYTLAPPVPAMSAVEEVTLTMTFGEARGLRILVGHIGGAGPIRKIISRIFDELEKVPGMPEYTTSPFECIVELSASYEVLP